MQSSNQPPIKLTTAQLWLAHTLFVISIAAAVAAGITVYGAFASGNHDWQVLGGLALAAAVAVGSKGWADKIQGNANFIPALMDTANEIRDIVSQAPTVMPVPVQPQGPLVTIHTTAMPTIAQQPAQPPPAPLPLSQRPTAPQPVVAPPVQQGNNAQGWPPLHSDTAPVPMSSVPNGADMAQVPVTPPETGEAMLERNWNPSAVLPVVQPAGQ